MLVAAGVLTVGSQKGKVARLTSVSECISTHHVFNLGQGGRCSGSRQQTCNEWVCVHKTACPAMISCVISSDGGSSGGGVVAGGQGQSSGIGDMNMKWRQNEKRRGNRRQESGKGVSRWWDRDTLCSSRSGVTCDFCMSTLLWIKNVIHIYIC